MEDIIQEKISADHLLYVSLKYTKTCDVIINLLLRWSRMIEISLNEILKHAKEKKKISIVPDSPIEKVEKSRELFKKDKNFRQTLDNYLMFRKIKDLKKDRIGEFRKNVALKVYFRGEEVEINLDKLKEYAIMIEGFVSSTKKYLLS